MTRARRTGRRLWALALFGAIAFIGLHIALTYALLERLELRVLIADAGVAALVLIAAGWYIGSLARERQRHAARSLLFDLLAQPRNIEDTANTAVRALIGSGLAGAGVIALAQENDDDLRVLAAAGFPDGWVREAPPAHLINATTTSVRREREPRDWVAALEGAQGRRPWVARVPLTSGGDAIGLLLLAARRPGPLRDPAVLATIAAQLSAAFDHAALYEAAYRRERDLEEQDHRRREFMAAISHEIRTPLTSIQAFADLLRMDTSTLDESAEELVVSLTHGVDRLNRLVGDLIDLGRAGGQEHEAHATEADVRESLWAAESVLRPVFLLREQTLTLDVPDRPLHALLDHRHLEQVVLSLLSNANRHAPPRGAVSLRAFRTDNGRVRIEVEDSGPGIALEDRERIFEPYYRVPRTDGTSVPGSGLGLAVARQLMDLQGGRIWVEESEDAGGARFCIEVRGAREHL